MRILVLPLAFALAACPSGDADEVIAGVLAVRGRVVYRDQKTPEGKNLLAGHVLRRGGVIEMEAAEVAVEGFNTLFAYERGSGKTKVRKLRRIDSPAPAERETRILRRKIEKRTAPPFPVAHRYELPLDVRSLKVDDTPEEVKNLSYFFLPHDEESSPATPGLAANPQLARGRRTIHPVRVDPPEATPESPRSLFKTEGPVVVELSDMACAFAADLRLPLSLEHVRRIIVLEDGEAELHLDGTVIGIDEDEDVFVAP